MSSYDTLVAWVQRTSHPDYLHLRKRALNEAWRGSRKFRSPMEAKRLCEKMNISYTALLSCSEIDEDGYATLEVQKLLARGYDAEAYQLAMLCFVPSPSVKIEDVFPEVDEWGL